MGDTPSSFKVPYVPVKSEKEEIVSEEGFYMSGSGAYVSPETVARYPRLTNLPTLYINIDSPDGLGSVSHGVYSQATYTFASDYVIDSYYEKNLQIKGRGNWSWSFDQKPYTLKLSEKADLCGMGEAKKWILVTVHSDKTMMHNYITQKLAKNMGLYGSCDNEYVDVVCNGEYVGTYVLTEKIQIHENRIDLGEKGGMLFEIEMVYRHSCKEYCLTLYNNESTPANSVHLKLIEYGDYDLDGLTKLQRRILDQRMKALQDHFDSIAAAMQTGDMESLKNTTNIDSFVNWYLLNELTRNYDSAFVTSCYCFFDESGRLYMGPVWDFDTCYGIQDPAHDTQHIQDAPWFNWLMNNCPEFVDMVKARWTELRNDGTINDFVNAIDDIDEHIKESEILQHTLYPDSELKNVPYDEAVQYFKHWLSKRLVWMDQNFLIGYEEASSSNRK